MNYQKKKFLKGMVLAFFLFLSFHTTKADSLNVTKGMTLTYRIVRDPDTMKLIVMIKEVSDKVVFDFIIRSKNSFYGRVTMTAEALEKGIRQYNYSVKGDVELTNATAVWVSQLYYTKFKDSVLLQMAPDGKEKIYHREKFMNYEVLKDGKKIKIPCFQVLSDGSPRDEFVIADNKSFPIIMHMNMGFDFDLIEIKSEEQPPH